MTVQLIVASRTISSRVCRAAPAIAATFLFACEPGPCLDLEKGDRLGITIKSSTSPCMDELDLQEGRRLTATLREPADNEHTNCQYWQADFGRVGRWIWTRRIAVGFQGTIGGSYSLVRDDGCAGDVRANVDSDLPPALGGFDVRFQGNSSPPPCPASCVADLDVEVEKL